MVKNTPIICYSCDKDTGYTQEQFTYYFVSHDIKCPHCQAVIIKANKVTYNANLSGDISKISSFQNSTMTF